MDCITIQKYAAQNRLSIHTVIKKTMNGELPTLVKEEDGKEVTYIIVSEPNQPRSMNAPLPDSDEIEIDYKKEYETLHKEHLVLKNKYEKLLQAHSNN